MNPGRGHTYDVAIVGAGIAGTEAALACAKAGLDVLLVTTILDTCYNLFEAGVLLQPPLQSFMTKTVKDLADERGYVSSWELHRAAKFELEHTKGIHFLQSSVSGLTAQENNVTGLETWEGVPRLAKKVALCVGSFLEARLTIGNLTESAGRLSEMSYDDLYLDLEARGFQFRQFEQQVQNYTVSYKVFADGEIDKKTLGSSRLNNLYAAGTCVLGATTYEDVARHGLELARGLVGH
ncbi:MAG: FAD-dependent oxidoreductase [Trueperaceae bacterium]